MIKIVEAGASLLERILERKIAGMEEARAVVARVLAAVRERGDEAVCEFTVSFGGPAVAPVALRVSEDEIAEAYRQVDDDFLAALRLALENVTAFHRRELRRSWLEAGTEGVILGQLVRPLKRVGIYVPGGTAAYPSSVLMSAVPARVAGVAEIAMVTPPAADGTVSPYTLVAAAEAGVTEIYRVGGAQAVAALAYGTAAIRKVDKITGPGNIYVTLAKQQVYGIVDIDMLAGPSEVLVVADGTAKPDWVAADMLSQAEHDRMAAAVLITPDRELARRVQEEIERQVPALPRREVISHSLAEYGFIVITADLKEALELANRFAPEHLELMVAEPFRWLPLVENAGAVFLGHHSPEAVGDYLAGPSHILPTGGSARFFSVLGLETFLRRTSVISYTPAALAGVGRAVVKMAGVEGLTAHARSVEVRLE
jgi:histidinol dehydrogenase